MYPQTNELVTAMNVARREELARAMAAARLRPHRVRRAVASGLLRLGTRLMPAPAAPMPRARSSP